MIFTALSGKYRKNLGERFGYIPHGIKRSPGTFPVIWIQAVSLGEIRVAKSIVEAIRKSLPGCSVVLSTTTEHGRALAKEIFFSEAKIIYSPVDVFLIIKKVLSIIDPDILIFLETEIWPSWIIESRRHGVKTVLLNGRISKRSFKHYLRLRLFFKAILQNIDFLSMISETDRERAIELGASPEKTAVNGNAKYDFIFDRVLPGKAEELREKLLIDKTARVIVAGSTRTGEEDILLSAYRKIIGKFPNTLLIVAPRHLERVDQIVRLLKKEGFGYHLRGEFDGRIEERQHDIIIVDKYGELFNLYGIADVAFCGASFVPLGGQNPFEPAAWAVPVLHGPHMDDFQDAALLLDETGGSTVVEGESEFANSVIELLSDEDLLREKGKAAREAFLKNHLAAERHAVIVKDLVEKAKRN